MQPKVSIDSYSGREQAYIKHYLLQEYLPDLGYKIGSKWDNLIYVDGFAGPWGVQEENCADSSFGVALNALRGVARTLNERQKSLNVHSFLVERNPQVFPRLRAFATTSSTSGFKVEAIQGEFISKLESIDLAIKKYGKSTFKFVLLDPKGWKDIPLLPLKSFLKDRSGEVLINLMTRHIIRFINETDRADSYHQLFGRDDVLPIIQTTPPADRPDVAVREYCKSLRDICGFRYVSSAIIFEPGQESVRYFLVYATNSPKGVEVFKAAETKAARLQDEIRHEAKLVKTKQPEFIFDAQAPKSAIALVRWKKYSQRAKHKVISLLLKSNGSLNYSDLYCEAMAFPLVTPKDLESWIISLEPAIRVDLEGGTSRKKPQPDKLDIIRVNDPDYLTQELARVCSLP